MLFASVILGVFAIKALSAHLGVDLSVSTDLETFECLRNDHDVEYAIIRAYRSAGDVDSAAPASIRAAHMAGISTLSAYIFPCIQSAPLHLENDVTCPSIKTQILDTVSLLASGGIFFNGSTVQPKIVTKRTIELNRLWLDIEDETPSKYFSTNVTENQQTLIELVDVMTSLQIPIGIYTTKSYWEKIMGNIEGFGTNKYPLWYPRYDATDDMEFFEEFVDFTHVSIKQTGGDVGYCGISQVDSDYSEEELP